MTSVSAADPLPLTDEQRAGLERWARSTSASTRTVAQAKALLLAGEGVANYEIARRVGFSANSVRTWRARFAERGLAGVGVIAPGRGRRSWLPEGKVAEIVRVTMNEKPDDEGTHWTTRLLSKRWAWARTPWRGCGETTG